MVTIHKKIKKIYMSNSYNKYEKRSQSRFVDIEYENRISDVAAFYYINM